MKLRWSLALSLLSVAGSGVYLAARPTASASTAQQPAAAEVHYFNPQLSPRAASRLRPLLDVIERYLATVDEAASAQLGAPLRHEVSGAYGSGFLLHNVVGNDLDYFADVHLGQISLERGDARARSVAAAELLRRLRIYRDAAEREARAATSPALAALRFMEPLPPATSAEHEQLQARVAESIERAIERAPYLAVSSFGDELRVTAMDAGEAYLPLVANCKFFSNAVDHSEGAFVGIRAVGMQLFFSFDLEVRDMGGGVAERRRVPWSPLTPPRTVGHLWQQAFTAVFASVAGADVFERVALDRAAGARRRLEYGQGYLGSLELESDVRYYPIKFVKRLHSMLDAVSPLLHAERSRELYALIDQQLHADVALYADQLKTFGENLALLARQPELWQLYLDSGDLELLLAFLHAAATRLSRDAAPAPREHALAALRAVTALRRAPALTAASAEALRAHARDIEARGTELVRALGLSQDEMRRIKASMHDVYAGLGYQPVRIGLDPAGALVVHPADLACANGAGSVMSAAHRLDATLRVGTWEDFGVEASSRLRRGAAEPLASTPRPPLTLAARPQRAPARKGLRPALQYVRCEGAPAHDARDRDALEALRRGEPLARQRAPLLADAHPL